MKDQIPECFGQSSHCLLICIALPIADLCDDLLYSEYMDVEISGISRSGSSKILAGPTKLS
jgi:hypothetical protein